MHQHISCGAPIFLWRDNVGEQLGAFGATRIFWGWGFWGALGATRSNSDYCLNSLTSSTS